MHASVRRYEAADEEAVQVLITRVQEEFVERVETIEGFVGYYVIDGGDGTLTSVTVGETEEAVEASNVLDQRVGSRNGRPPRRARSRPHDWRGTRPRRALITATHY
jgi:hypothetical protein